MPIFRIERVERSSMTVYAESRKSLDDALDDPEFRAAINDKLDRHFYGEDINVVDLGGAREEFYADAEQAILKGDV